MQTHDYLLRSHPGARLVRARKRKKERKKERERERERLKGRPLLTMRKDQKPKTSHCPPPHPLPLPPKIAQLCMWVCVWRRPEQVRLFRIFSSSFLSCLEGDAIATCTYCGAV
ncbi:hypothetical protein K504DRAFT_238632 [Pleomassaria siparia CBS 279.74]|uniref:Uncharacterized protein n=1 Tax=Pleomassaria siparia CBS 279.74 TaxID=1314801 RepID=A0A6G1KE70_9PLEO|nr:hypothetical protein K504DRAFT_238632 [Pleomassaria siparia CBS 279.74]